ncbi:hypothetical protein [Nocardioides sp. cx-173]|uniref:hypothetical protein n=1 Tax=Nocardioides sp. cx-173 TaxID=2898796 RepID=UPI001E578D26|nr:hypothetical protein [Nocardioides sp. cx-173]MCD4524759.1 hypothetical protein [Nocardioides sp. cx-173]UGB43267.1 hypothetical protein LQ940_06995 [Nocardioides sp. cx-173]
MLIIILVMAAILVLCGLVLTYVAFPHRGADVPTAPWLGKSMAKAVDALPTLDAEDDDQPRTAGSPLDQRAPR